MTAILKKTMTAVLAASVALGSGLPALAQGAPPAAPMAGAGGPDGSAPVWLQFDFKAFDKDGDGKVTRAEVQAGRAERVKAVDADGDGLLSAEEMIAADLVREKVRVEDRVKARIAAQDADGDGKLSAAELMVPPGAARLFDRIDADNDGAVTEAELTQARAAMRQKMMDRMQDRRDGHGPWDGQGWYGPAQN